MTEVDEDRFRSLVRQVRALERTVEEQQKQIAKLKHRTTTDPGSQSSSSSSSPSDEVPRSSIELQVLSSLEDNAADEEPLSVEQIKHEAAQNGLLRSKARHVVENWIQEGFLTGDLEDTVKVVEFPPETVPTED